MLLALVSTSGLYQATFVLQVAFYTVALAGGTRVPALRIPSFLLRSNIAILKAWIRFARGERMTLWNPSERLAALPQPTSR